MKNVINRRFGRQESKVNITRFLFSICYTLLEYFPEITNNRHETYFSIADNYIKILHDNGSSDNCVLFYSLCNEIDPIRTRENLIEFLAKISDETQIRYVKQELMSKFSQEACQDIILAAAQKIQ